MNKQESPSDHSRDCSTPRIVPILQWVFHMHRELHSSHQDNREEAVHWQVDAVCGTNTPEIGSVKSTLGERRELLCVAHRKRERKRATPRIEANLRLNLFFISQFSCTKGNQRSGLL